MKRRQFVILIGGAAAAFGARAATTTQNSCCWSALARRLEDKGVHLDHRFPADNPDRFRILA
jgi:hypothetical protein